MFTKSSAAETADRTGKETVPEGRKPATQAWHPEQKRCVSDYALLLAHKENLYQLVPKSICASLARMRRSRAFPRQSETARQPGLRRQESGRHGWN